MDMRELTKEKPRKHVEIAYITKDERSMITKAVRALNTRKPVFYKQAIIEKAQSVLSSTSTDISDNTGASSDRGGASVCEEE